MLLQNVSSGRPLMPRLFAPSAYTSTHSLIAAVLTSHRAVTFAETKDSHCTAAGKSNSPYPSLLHPCATCSVSSSLSPILSAHQPSRSVATEAFPRFAALRFVSQRLDPPQLNDFPNHAISCHHGIHGDSNQVRCGQCQKSLSYLESLSSSFQAPSFLKSSTLLSLSLETLYFQLFFFPRLCSRQVVNHLL